MWWVQLRMAFHIIPNKNTSMLLMFPPPSPQVLSPLSRGAFGVVVVSEEGKLVNLVTDRDVIRYFWGHLENVASEAGNSIETLGVYKGPSKVLVMYDDRPAITGYALMAIHGVKSMPILGQ